MTLKIHWMCVTQTHEYGKNNFKNFKLQKFREMIFWDSDTETKVLPAIWKDFYIICIVTSILRAISM